MEKLKESFGKERADWNTEKYALRKRAEDAEATPDPEETEADDLLNDPLPQDHDFLAE